MFVRKKECLTGRNNVCQESIKFEMQVVGRMFLPRKKNVLQDKECLSGEKNVNEKENV